MLDVVELHRDGERIPVRRGKTTEVLIRLALEAGSMVRTELLIEDLWADEAVCHGAQHAPDEGVAVAAVAG